jgi:hypothetical protein
MAAAGTDADTVGHRSGTGTRK